MGASSAGSGGGGGNSASSNYQKQIKKTYNKEEEKKAKAREDARVNQYSGNKGKGKKKTTTTKTKTVNRVTNDGNDGNKAPPKKPTQPKEITKAQIGTLSDPREKDDTAAKASLFKETGATKIKDTQMGTASITKPFFQEGSRKTRDYFKQEVLGKGAYKGTSLEDFESKSLTEQENIYQDYIQGRSAGTKDAYGRDIVKPKDDAPKETVKTSILSQPAEAETEAETAKKEEKEDEYDVRKIKKRGRRRNILTSSRGVTTVSPSFSLGRPSLLGV